MLQEAAVVEPTEPLMAMALTTMMNTALITIQKMILSVTKPVET